ncbi:hypothetical protein [Balneatrix alpica]|uniref:Uncharacterized protein n=1 Tax=Balneatrix alpica TaxID=75684 RepID=A0ABV5ZCB6_9GAMM|nr:hypothetical protein [Balneatrix alpica]
MFLGGNCGNVFEGVVEIDINRGIAILAVIGFGIFSVIKVFAHMKDGFGVFNVRIAGIVIVANFASMLAVLNLTSEAAAIGILGAIAGYLFGFGTENKK